MRALNVFLCFVVSALLGLVVLELGLRALGKGPQPTINRFDPVLGWSKTPNETGERKTSEFHVCYEINALGLRDDPMTSAEKPAGALRVLMLGDSFVLGYTVNRSDLFVDLLEVWWRAEGRCVDVVNAGTEGYSTDQEVAWLEENGAAFQPDVVVLFPYENDLYWNGETHYRRFPKPRYTAFGDREHLVLPDPGPKPWYEKTALGTLWSALHETRSTWSPDGVHRLEMEQAAYFRDPPREFMTDAIARTRGALVALKADCAKLGARLCVAPIPGKASIEAGARRELARSLRVDPSLWSPDQPVETFLALARDLDLDTFDARAALRADAEHGHALYFQTDWHLNEHGNRAFAEYLHDALESAGVFAPSIAATRAAAMPSDKAASHIPAWLPWYAALWLALSTLYALTYRDEPWWRAALGVAGMLALVFGIAIGGGSLLKLVPPSLVPILMLLVVATILSFAAFKLGQRVGTIAELLVAFTRRGHWYLMPLVVVLLSVGSLLVIAASSPLIAPFIYTLF